MAAADQPAYEQRMTTLTPRVFLDRLHERRDEVYEHATHLERSDSIAAFVFDLLVRLAQHNHSFIDRSLIQRLSDQLERFEEPISEVNIPLMEGMVLTLEQALTLGAPPPSTHEILNALFARGYQIYLEAKTTKERQEFASKVIKLLPSIERLGPYSLSSFVDFACEKEEAIRFWQLYAERVAAEVERRTQPTERDPYTWVLSALLDIEESGPNALIGKRWEVLRRHIERIMQSRQEDRRWRYLRLITESCRDHRALYFILSSPAVIEDQSIPFIFLTRGNRKLQSCALFLLHITRTNRKQIHKLLEYFEDRSLAEIGERAVELYAQTQLFASPSPVIETLAEGITSIITHKLKEEPVDSLLNAVTNDAHAFRQSLFLVEVIPSDRHRNSPAHIQLLERVLQSFFHTFTPSGVRHPLNDQIFQAGVSKAISELMRDHDGGHSAHLKSFGFTLNKAAKRWRPGESEEELSKQHLLLSYFIGLYVHVLRRAARRLYRKYDTRPRAIELYDVIVKLFLREPAACFDSGAYEAFLPLLNSLFPELTSSDYLEEPTEGRVEQAAQLIGSVEEERTPEENLAGLLSEWRERNRGRDLIEATDETREAVENADEAEQLAVELKGHVPVVTTVPVKAPVKLYDLGQSTTGKVLRTFLGLNVLNYYTRKLLSIFGIATRGELSLAGEQIFLEERHSINGQGTLGHKSLRFHVSQLSGVELEQPMRGFYLVFGILSLVTLCFMGGHLLFAGVRGAETGLGLLGLGFILMGFAIDTAMSALRESSSQEVLLRLERHNSPRPLVLGVDRVDPRGQALMNAFMSEAVKQREEHFIQSLAEAAERAAIAQLEAAQAAENAPTNDEGDDQADEEIEGSKALDEPADDDEDPEGSRRSDQDVAGEERDLISEPPVSALGDDEVDVPENQVNDQALDISFEDEESGLEEDDGDYLSPLTVTPPLPGEGTLVGLDKAIEQVLSGNDPETGTDEDIVDDASERLDTPRLSQETDLTSAYEFVTAQGSVQEQDE